MNVGYTILYNKPKYVPLRGYADVNDFVCVRVCVCALLIALLSVGDTRLELCKIGSSIHCWFGELLPDYKRGQSREREREGGGCEVQPLVLFLTQFRERGGSISLSLSLTLEFECVLVCVERSNLSLSLSLFEQ